MNEIFVLYVRSYFSCNSNFNLDEKWNEAIEYRKKSNFQKAITSLKEIIESGKNNSFSAQAQYQLADIYLNDVNNYTFSIKEFESLIDKYPNSEFAKRSIFMLGYINSNYTESYDNAIMYYNMFLENYPDDDLALSVNYELNLLDSLGTINALKKLRKK